MAGFLYVRSRGARPLDPARRARLGPLARRLAPDNIAYPQAVVAERGGEALTVFDDGCAVRREQTSVCVGWIFESATPWWRVGSEPPDGSFALVRSDGAVTEAVTDAVGTRTLWYAHTGDELVVSTSQRAIVMWLESYECNLDAFAWQISSGTLGPGLSWDRRLRAMPPASRLTLDGRSWSVELTSERVEYRPALGLAQREELRGAIKETFRHVDFDSERSALALSGGYDSRLILLMLKDRPLHTVTWGRRSALAERNNDASIAQQLAETAHTQHEYLELDLAPQDADEVLERFVRLGEGRIENLSGYTDGFAVWKHLREEGVSGLYRGDEAFGCQAAATPADVYRNMKCNVLADFKLDAPSPLVDLAARQRRPARLERRPTESLAAWRDRLNAEFELPYVMGALNDLKCHYLDVVHPLVSRRIVEQARRLPDELRTDKAAFKSIVEEFGLEVPYARCSAIAPPDVVLRDACVIEALRERLREHTALPGTTGDLAEYALTLLPRTPRRELLPGFVSRFVGKARRRVRRTQRLDPLRVAFRIYIIGNMQMLLKEDARALH